MEKLVALLSVFGLGMSFSLLGSIGVKLMPRVKIDQGKFGSLISAFMFTCLLASLVMGVIIDSIGYKPVAMFGFIATAVCIFILAYGKSYNSVLVPCILLGFGAMALNTVGNTLIPEVLYGGTNKAAASNLGNTFFGLGLFLTPLVVSFLFRKTTYEKAVSALGIVVLLPAVLAFITKYPVVPAGFSIGDAVKLLAEPAVLISAFVLFCYIALEASFCNWLAPFGKEVLTASNPEIETDVADASAQRLLSLFAIAMMIGRLLASQISVITQYGSYFIAGAAILTAVIISMMVKTKSPQTSRVLAVLAGLAFAPCFPTTVGVTFEKFDSSYGSIFGIIFAVGLAGAVIIPKAIGNMAKGSTIQKSMKLLVPASVLLAIMALIMSIVKGPV
ncbi:MAG: MFS transporter [Planctomycetes bacterium]|nr:MFS transporter [Planctomycetota bacterium]